MDRVSSRIWRIRKEILEIESKEKTLYRNKKQILRNLNRANREYELGEISYSRYSEIWNSFLQGYSLEELVSRYDYKIRSLDARKKALKQTISELRAHKERNAKALSISLSLLMMFTLMAGIGVMSTEITGFAVIEQELIIEAYYAIQLSENIIEFGTLDPDTINNSAILNNETIGATGYYLELSQNSNVPVRVNISADGPLISGANILGESNITWSSANVSNSSIPSIADAIPLTTSSTITTPDFMLYNSTEMNKVFYRFWIDIPGNVPPGLYSNNITFEAYRSE